jgi:hypothetical protein
MHKILGSIPQYHKKLFIVSLFTMVPNWKIKEFGDENEQVQVTMDEYNKYMVE